MHPKIEHSCVPKELLHPGLTVMDIVYNPLNTQLLQDAQAAGCPTIQGIEMFLHQAVGQFELWTGQPAPVDTMPHPHVSLHAKHPHRHLPTSHEHRLNRLPRHREKYRGQNLRPTARTKGHFYRRGNREGSQDNPFPKSSNNSVGIISGN